MTTPNITLGCEVEQIQEAPFRGRVVGATVDQNDFTPIVEVQRAVVGPDGVEHTESRTFRLGANPQVRYVAPPPSEEPAPSPNTSAPGETPE